MQRSILWRQITVFQLNQNMCLNTAIKAEVAFPQWQLEVGHGEHTDETGNISLPDHFKSAENTVDSLIDSIYPNIHIPNLCDQYLLEHIILCTLNQQVNLL